jgi:hypothetical protein
MKPRSVEDCAVVTSLVRPGPLEFIDERTGRNMAQEYVERRHGRSKGEIPILDELLPETYGVMVFQEQSTKMTKELTGWDDEKAEDVRIAVGKKKLRMIEELKPQFIEASNTTTLLNGGRLFCQMLKKKKLLKCYGLTLEIFYHRQILTYQEKRWLLTMSLVQLETSYLYYEAWVKKLRIKLQKIALIVIFKNLLKRKLLGQH